VNLFVNLFMIGWKHPFFIRPSGVGSLRYFSSKVDEEMPSVDFISSYNSDGQTELNKIEHLLGLSS
jgi:hypothetical protein